jgi:uncharacterized zinc-type alcohol dehydrogenase-like protein
MAAARDWSDVLIETIPVPHDIGPHLGLVAVDGTLGHLGHLGPVTVETLDLLIGRKKLGSADIEPLPSAQVTDALERLERNDVRFRFVLGLSDLP